MDRKQMEKENARLEAIRAQRLEGQAPESVADEYGIEHAAQSEQEKATKAAADKKQLKESFEHAHDGKMMEKGHQEGPQQDSQQVRETGQNPRPIPPPGLDRAGAQNAHQASMVRDDQASKKKDSDLEAFREREGEIGQQEHVRDTMNVEGQAPESVADEYGIEHAGQSEQEKATKAAADKKQLKKSFEHAHDGKLVEEGPQDDPDLERE